MARSTARISFAILILIIAGTFCAIANAQPKHVMFAFVDHFEPITPSVPEMRIWVDDFISMSQKHVDADGRHPNHSYFMYWYGPIKTRYYDCPNDLMWLNKAAYYGYGEVDYHFHHGLTDERTRTEQQATDDFISKTQLAQSIYQSYGALITAEPSPKTRFAFIHGMWALDNSRYDDWTNPADPRPAYCGVNTEISLLKQFGCYADFTFPAWGPMEPTLRDTMFYVKDTNESKSYANPENIRQVIVGEPEFGDLMILDGPNNTTNIGFARASAGGILYDNPPTLARMDGWVTHNVHVQGNNDWVFVKVYTHGCYDAVNYYPVWDYFFGPTADKFHSDIEAKYNDGVKWKLHYVSAREMYNIVKAAEAGMTGDPDQYRDYTIKPYANMRILTKNKYNLISYGSDNVVIRNIDVTPFVQYAFKQYTPMSSKIEESQDPNVGWTASNASPCYGELSELSFTDTTPSLFYRVSKTADVHTDINGDGSSNLIDFALLESRFDESGCVEPDWCGGADIDRNGTVNISDLIGFIGHWLFDSN